jgi:hypothetical protein
LAYINCSAQYVAAKRDTLLKKENVMLYLDNGFSIPPFAVSGDLFLTTESFVFHPKQYRRKRFEMYNNWSYATAEKRGQTSMDYRH